MREGKKGGAQSEVDIGLSPSEEMLPIALVKYVCIEVEVAQEKNQIMAAISMIIKYHSVIPESRKFAK